MKLNVNEGNFLSAKKFHELKLKRKQLTITGFEEIEFRNGKKKIAMKFKEIPDILCLNSTNQKILKKAWGEETDTMIGKTIYLNIIPATYEGQAVESIIVDTE